MTFDDDPFADLIPSRQDDDPFADLIPQAGLTNPQGVSAGDYGRAVMAGGGQLFSGAGWLASKVPGLEGAGQGMQRLGQQASDFWVKGDPNAPLLGEGMSPAARAEQGKDFIKKTDDGSGFFGYEWGDASPHTAGLSAAQSLLGTAAGMGVGGALAKGLQVAGLGARTAGVIGYGAGEAGVASGSAGHETYRSIMAMPVEKLEIHPEFQELLKQPGSNRNTVKEQIANLAANQSAATTAGTTFALSAPMGALIGKIMAGVPIATTKPRAIGTAAAGEAGQEFLQSGAEQMAQNKAVQDYADQSRGIGEGVLNAAVGGAAAGGIMGGGLGFSAVTEVQGERDAIDSIKGIAENFAFDQISDEQLDNAIQTGHELHQKYKDAELKSALDALAAEQILRSADKIVPPGQQTAQQGPQAVPAEQIIGPEDDVAADPNALPQEPPGFFGPTAGLTMPGMQPPVQTTPPPETTGYGFTGQAPESFDPFADLVPQQEGSTPAITPAEPLPNEIGSDNTDINQSVKNDDLAGLTAVGPAVDPAILRQQKAKANYQKAAKIDERSDPLGVIIAKLGGVNSDEAEQNGFDKESFRGYGWKIKRVFNKNGDSLDGMRERLNGYGFDFPDVNSLIDALQEDMAGNRKYTPAGYETLMEKQALEPEREAEPEQPGINGQYDVPLDEYTGDMYEDADANEPEYNPNWGEEAKQLYELLEEASAIDKQAAKDIWESGRDERDVAVALYDFIRDNESGAQGDRGEGEAQQGTGAQAEAPGTAETTATEGVTPNDDQQRVAGLSRPPAETVTREPVSPGAELADTDTRKDQVQVDVPAVSADLLGDDTRTAQSVADAKIQKDKKPAEEPALVQSGDELFANNGKLEPDLFDAAAHEAATSPKNDTPQPTEAQIEAGNYRKGHVSIHGLNVSIENPIGSTRSGTSRSGRKWSRKMKHHYGYIKGTVGRDKDHVDVFIGDGAEKAQLIYVVDQIDPTAGKFDEHKVVMTDGGLNAAEQIYLDNYAPGWKGMGAITAMPIEDFKAWVVDQERTKKPVAYTKPAKPIQGENLGIEKPENVDAAPQKEPKQQASKKEPQPEAEARVDSAYKATSPAFTPTHELPDGTQVVATDEPGVWMDEEGSEIEDDNATPIEKKPAKLKVEAKNEPKELDQPSKKPLAGVPAGAVSQPEKVIDPGKDAEAGGRTDSPRNESVRGKRDDDAGGVGDDAGEVPVSTGGDRGAGSGGKPGSQSVSGVDSDTKPVATGSGAVTTAKDRAQDFSISPEDQIGSGGAKTKFKNNVAAIELLKALQRDNRQATRAEQSVLAKYVGWGGIPQAFYKDDGETAAGWEKEAQALNDLLTEQEYDAARRSTQDAHYTSTEIVSAIWGAAHRFGFRGGKVLEPSVGVGNFFGMMPKDIRSKSGLTGVELDHITGGIAKQLYPGAHILDATGFQEFTAADNTYDLAIGNPPFGSQKLYDGKRKAISNFSIHNYFFAKSVDLLKPNGVLAMVVSNSMLDAGSSKAREYIAARTEFIGAIRLPNNAFKVNAGTEVTADIVFLRKLRDGEQPHGEAWNDITEIPDPLGGAPIPINEYFARHPENMLGRMERSGSMHRAGQSALVANEGQDTAALINEAVSRMPRDFMDEPGRAPVAETIDIALDVKNVRVGSMFKKDGEVYVRKEDEENVPKAEKVEFTRKYKGELIPDKKAEERAIGMIVVRDALTRLRKAQMDDSSTDAELKMLRAAMNRTYDGFVKRQGPINVDANKRIFRDDPTWPQIAALEESFDKGVSLTVSRRTGEKPRKPSAKKAAIFSKRTQSPYKPVKYTTTAKDALVATLSEKGRVDMDYLASLYGKSKMQIREELRGLILRNPAGDWETRDQYLSGNVKAKLAVAEEAAKTDAEYQENIEALKAVQPADIEAIDIDVKIGAHWLPPSVMGAFVDHITGGDGGQANYSEYNAKWTFASKRAADAKATQWGTDRKRPLDLLSDIANQKATTVRDRMYDGSSVLNQAATDAAKEKAQQIKDEWRRWIWQDAGRRDTLARLYNDTFNTDVLREFDGSHLKFPGKISDDIVSLRPHQANAVWRIVQSGTTLLDHVVGAGKTYTIIAAAMEMRRLGLANKPVIAVPNHLVGQWAEDFIKLYPGANILAATKKDFEKANRKRLFARIATGDWDAVIVAHSSFGKVEVDPEYQAKFIEQQVRDIDTAIAAMKDAEGGKSRSVKDAEKQKDRLQEKLKALFDAENKDDSLYYGELGIDALFLDEAHEFKNLGFATSMTRVAGLGDPKGSQKAADMYMKIQYTLEKTGGRNVVFATGTPISNTMAEMYTMERYLDYKTLKAKGLAHFDAWARQYGEVVTDWELSPSGKYKLNSRFSKFVNMPELMQDYLSFSDVINRDDINKMLAAQGKKLPVPRIKGGKPQNVVVDRSDLQASYIGMPVKDKDGNDTERYPEGTLVWRSENLPKGPPKKGDDNMLKIMSDARKAALDMRLISPSYGDNEQSKINYAASEILRKYKEWDADRGAQLVFIDLSTPKNARSKEAAEIRALIERAEAGDEAAEEKLDNMSPDELDALNGEFSVYDDLREKLIALGIPDNEIAYIHQANTEQQKEDLFGKVRSGRIRVLLGSTAKMGAGMNVQERLVALHHMDAPWRPSDLEQREGRIIRQGNALYDRDPEGFEIEIMRYATKQTLDSRMWQTIEGKARFIEQVRKGNLTAREVEDVAGEAANAAEMKAASSGNPLILEEMEIRSSIRRMEGLQYEHDRQQFRIQDSIRHNQGVIEHQAKRIADLQKDIKTRDASATEEFSITIGGKEYDKRKDAGAQLILSAAELGKSGKPFKKAGAFQGFNLTLDNLKERGFVVSIQADAGEHQVDLVDISTADPVGLITKINNVTKGFEKAIDQAQAWMDNAKAEIPELKSQLKQWDKSDELKAMKARHAEIITELRPKKKEEGKDIDSPDDSAILEVQEESDYVPTQTEVDEDHEAAAERSVDALGLRRGSLLANAITKDFRDKGKVDLIGQKVESAEDLAVLAQVYRNPSFETFRIFYVKDGKVIHQTGVTSRLPGSSVIFVDGPAKGLKGIRDTMQSLGADGYYMLHNHPSGNPKPSPSDIRTTQELVERTEGFLSHVIIDHTQYATINTDADVDLVRLPDEALQGDRYGNNPTKPHPLLGYEISSPTALAMVGLDLKSSQNYFQVVGTNRTGITGIMDVPADEFFRSKLKQIALIKKFQRATGSVDVFVVNAPSYMHEMLATAIRNDVLRDASFVDGSSVMAKTGVSAEPGVQAGRRLGKGYRVSDDAAGYTAWLNNLKKGQPLDRVFRIPFNIIGSIDAHGVWHPPEKVKDFSSKASIRLNAAAKKAGEHIPWAASAINAAKAGLIDRYGLDEHYKARDAQREADERKLAMEGIAFIQDLERRGVDIAEAKVLQAVLTGEEINATDWATVALPIRQAIDEMGQEAVQLGLISPEAYQRNKGAYLHRVYRKHEDREEGLSSWASRVMSSRRKKLVGNTFKGRGMDLKLTQARLLKDVPPDWFGTKSREGQADKQLVGKEFIVFDLQAPAGQGTATAPGIGEGGRKPRIKQRVYWPADHAVPARFGAWENKGTWEVRSVQGDKAVLWRDFTKAERNSMGEILDARYTIGKTYQQMSHDLATGRFLKDIATNDAWTWNAEGEPENSTTAKEGGYRGYSSVEWVKVPESTITKTGGRKRWGALAGKYVRAEIWRDLNELDRMNVPGTWRKILTQWKLNKTARNPVVHMNNVMSNLLLMDMADVRMQDLMAGIQSMHAKDADYQDAMTHGAFGSSFVNQEIQRNILDPLLEELKSQNVSDRDFFEQKVGKLGRILDLTWKYGKKGDKWMINAYQIEDEIFRMATYMRRRAQGETAEQAATTAREQFLNYDIRAPWINALRSSVLPFISYTYRAVPIVAESIARRPWKLAKYMTVAYALNALAYALSDDDNEDKERKAFRDQEQGNTWIGVPRMMRMPWKDSNDNPVFLDIRRWIPAGDVFDMNQGQVGIPAPLQLGGPLMLAGELMLNKTAFTGKEIWNNKTDDPVDAVEKVADWAWKSWMPSAPWMYNSWYWDKIGKSIDGAKDYRGREYDLGYALASSVGIKLRQHDVAGGMMWKKRDFDSIQRALEFDMRMLNRDRMRGLVSADSFQDEREAIKDKMKRLRDKAKEVFSNKPAR